MSFQLLGFDFIPKDRLFGFWLCEIKSWKNDKQRDLFSIYCDDGYITIGFCYTKWSLWK